MENRFNYLLAALVALLLLGPAIEVIHSPIPLNALIFLVAILFTLRSVMVNKKLFYVKVALAIVAFIVTVLAQNNLMDGMFGLGGSAIYIVFILSAGLVLTKRLILEKQIKVDTIIGGICVYFLIGLLWSLFYSTLHAVNPSAFNFGNVIQPQHYHFQYYSFTVLTTLGFGDIVPVSHFAINLTSLESIAGEMFLAVFIARLIGLYIAQELNK